MYSEETLVEKYRKNSDIIKEASIPLDYEHINMGLQEQSSREAPLIGD